MPNEQSVLPIASQQPEGRRNKMKNCEGCIYINIRDGKVGWASSQPIPCINCERNQPILKDNYVTIRERGEKNG